MREVLVIHLEILQPQAGALAHRRELRGLKVRESESGHPLVFKGERRQFFHDLEQLALDRAQSLAHDYDFRIVRNVAARGTQMYDGHRGFGLHTMTSCLTSFSRASATS